MSYFDVMKWADREKASNPERLYSNGINYLFYQLPDGWTAIFEVKGGIYRPVIQAMSRDAALTYINLTEPVTVPMERIC